MSSYEASDDESPNLLQIGTDVTRGIHRRTDGPTRWNGPQGSKWVVTITSAIRDSSYMPTPSSTGTPGEFEVTIPETYLRSDILPPPIESGLSQDSQREAERFALRVRIMSERADMVEELERTVHRGMNIPQPTYSPTDFALCTGELIQNSITFLLNRIIPAVLSESASDSNWKDDFFKVNVLREVSWINDISRVRGPGMRTILRPFDWENYNNKLRDACHSVQELQGIPSQDPNAPPVVLFTSVATRGAEPVFDELAGWVMKELEYEFASRALKSHVETDPDTEYRNKAAQAVAKAYISQAYDDPAQASTLPSVLGTADEVPLDIYSDIDEIVEHTHRFDQLAKKLGQRIAEDASRLGPMSTDYTGGSVGIAKCKWVSPEFMRSYSTILEGPEIPGPPWEISWTDYRKSLEEQVQAARFEAAVGQEF